MKKRIDLSRVFTYIILAVMTVISVFPFYMMVMMSSYVTEDIFRALPLVPGDFFWGNLQTVFASNFLQAYFNSVVVSVVATAGCVLISAMAGYAITVYPIPHKKAVTTFVMMTMMVPTQIGVVGYTIEMQAFGLVGTLSTLVFFWLANGFGVFWMLQSIKSSLPLEIVESARMDGCNELRTFFQIVVPCIVPSLVTLTLLIFLWSWNSYFYPLILINDSAKYTLPLYIKSLSSLYRTDFGAQLAGLVLSTVPVIIIFVLGAKNFIKGLTAGAVKG